MEIKMSSNYTFSGKTIWTAEIKSLKLMQYSKRKCMNGLVNSIRGYYISSALSKCILLERTLNQHCH